MQFLRLSSAFAIVLSTNSAFAEDWIKPFCCPSRSCTQVTDSEVVPTPEGFHVVSIDETVSFSDRRLFLSGDHTIQLCIGEVPEPELAPGANPLVVKCLYVPLSS